MPRPARLVSFALGLAAVACTFAFVEGARLAVIVFSMFWIPMLGASLALGLMGRRQRMREVARAAVSAPPSK